MDQWRSLVPELAPFTVDPGGDDPCDFAPDDPEGTRIDTLQWHSEAVAGWHRGLGADPRICQPGDEPLPWQRGDLVWALSRAGNVGWGSDSGPYHVPAMIAQEIPAAWLAECEPALKGLLAQLGDEQEMPAHVRQSLADRFGRALARLGDTAPVADGRFSTAVYPILAGFRGDPALTLAASLTKPAPTRAWLRQAASLQLPAALRDVLHAFLCTTGAVHNDHDSLLRGVCWLVAAQPSEEDTELLAGVAVLAGEPFGRTAHPRAARTATAAVEILAGRPGAASSRALAQLARTARSRPLLARVQSALSRSGAETAWRGLMPASYGRE